MKAKLLPLLLCICLIGVANAQTKKFNQALADSLAKWVVIDQTAAGIPQGKQKELSKEKRQAYQDSVFNTHQKILARILKQYGYPGFDLVGKKGSNNFWLMVQHCDKQPEFQKQVLKAMKVEMEKGNADSKNYAYLTDRVNLNTGQKQVYATQLTYNTDSCQAIPRPLVDSTNVNERRKAVGLEPIEGYLNLMSQMHYDMNKAVYDKKGIYKPKLIAEPKAL